MFKNIFKGRLVIVGVGNTLRGDDGLGPALIAKLNGRIEAVCVDAGSAPENYLGKVVKAAPDTILIVDAMHLGLAPGAYRVLKKDDILNCGLTTHDISPEMLVDYLKKQTKADIFILGVQPKHLTLGAEMSAEVKQALEEIASLIKETDNARDTFNSADN